MPATTPAPPLRLARRARALANAAGVPAADVRDDPADAARRMAGRVKRADRAGDARGAPRPPRRRGGGRRVGAGSAPGLRAARGAVRQRPPRPRGVARSAERRATQFLRRTARAADLAVPDEESRAARLHALGLERAIDREGARRTRGLRPPHEPRPPPGAPVPVGPRPPHRLGRGAACHGGARGAADREREPRVRLGFRGRRRGPRHEGSAAPPGEAPLGRDVRRVPAVGRQGGDAAGRCPEGPARRRGVFPAAGPPRGRAPPDARAPGGAGGARRVAAPRGLPHLRGPHPACPQVGKAGPAALPARTAIRSSSTRRTSRA